MSRSVEQCRKICAASFASAESGMTRVEERTDMAPPVKPSQRKIDLLLTPFEREPVSHFLHDAFLQGLDEVHAGVSARDFGSLEIKCGKLFVLRRLKFIADRVAK